MKHLIMFEILENLSYKADKVQLIKDISEARKKYAELFAEEIEKEEEELENTFSNTIYKIIKEAKKC